MIDYEIHNNGWTVFVNEKIQELTEQQAQEVGRLVTENTVVVFRGQDLTTTEQMNFCNSIGECQRIYDPAKPLKGQRTEHIAVDTHIVRVTGQRNLAGEMLGLAGHNETLDWHADQPSKKDRYPLLWLYAVSGSEGSRTSWINLIDAYNDLPQELKERIADKKVICGFKDGTYTYNPFFKEHVARDAPFDLVKTNEAGKTGLYFPFLQMFEMVDTSYDEFHEIHDRLKDHVLQEKYMYHHDWQNGDVVLSEQWLGIHKRWAFENMNQRVMHRIAFDHKKIY